VVICPEQRADLHIAQLMPLPLTVSCFSKVLYKFVLDNCKCLKIIRGFAPGIGAYRGPSATLRHSVLTEGTSLIALQNHAFGGLSQPVYATWSSQLLLLQHSCCYDVTAFSSRSLHRFYTAISKGFFCLLSSG